MSCLSRCQMYVTSMSKFPLFFFSTIAIQAFGGSVGQNISVGFPAGDL